MVKPRSALLLALFLTPVGAKADEAVTQTGQRLAGTMRKTDFKPSDSEKSLPLVGLKYVRFADQSPPLPRCRPWHQLLFPDEQRLAGELVSVGPKEIRFRAAGGESYAVPRSRLFGVIQADGHLVQWKEDFEKLTDSWGGSPVFSDKHAFAGKKSLLVQGGTKEVSLKIPPVQRPMAAQRATLHFFDSAAKAEFTATLIFLFEAPGTQAPISLSLALGVHYGNDAGYGLKASPGWHVVHVDWQTGRVRIFIDDFLITSRNIPAAARLASCQFSAHGKGAMWFDSMWLAEIVPPLRRTPGPLELDEVWLAHGEQLFGSVIDADKRGVTLEARFGKRLYPWSNVRGFFFGSRVQKASPKGIEVHFRSAPGISSDCLCGEITDLNSEALVLRHAELGDVTIARSRLERIRFPGLAGK